jgi:EAL domain-containing protein (putative c-di-GMP-specific phosphodiesterase class I)
MPPQRTEFRVRSGKKVLPDTAILVDWVQWLFQPKFNLKTGAVIGVEVLARWRHASGKTLIPACFLTTLERYDLLDELLRQQLYQGLALQQQLRAQGHELNFAFNLHALQWSNGMLASQIRTLLREYGARGSSLTFELTESDLLQAPETSLECLFSLQVMDCRLSIKNFGTDYSSLQRLFRLPFNEIKLGAGFVQALPHEPLCQAVVGSTLALGEALGVAVVAEGIETGEQRRHLLNMGCTQGQGDWYVRPMSGADLLQWLGWAQQSCPRA